ncbi:protein SLC31A2-like isoform X2 [Convolutriloba macropyga]|uniref:protein SLC31A2-like isoform X2 n=1 Tax=Convolutriloba macropyga TaxID=536237 RepID=UPI003F528090
MLTHMSFTASSDVTILWEKWETKEAWQLFLSCVFWFILAVAYEGLKAARNFVCQIYAAGSSSSSPPGCYSSNGTSESGPESKRSLVNVKSSPPKILSVEHLTQTLLHFLQMTLGYLLMLVVMTFNVWLFIAVILGYTVGFFLFGWWCASDQSKHDHCG